MSLVLGIDEFRACAELAARVGKWEAWLSAYYPRFQDIFDAMLRYLYVAEFESLRDSVEGFDFDRAIQAADSFVSLGGVERVSSLLRASEEFLRADFDYDAYLLIGLGHVIGTALPARKPFTYLGLEHHPNLDGLADVVPHEFCHMARSAVLGEASNPNVLGERIVSEGLSCVCSLLVNQQEVTTDSLSSALMMPPDVLMYCDEHRKELHHEAHINWTSPMDQALTGEYFTGSDTGWTRGKPARSGNYIGARIVLDLLAQGADFAELVRTPADDLRVRCADGRFMQAPQS